MVADRRSDEGFLGRWSRLKQGSDVESAAPADALTTSSPQNPSDSCSAPELQEAGSPEGVSVEPPLTDADMPPLETLGADSDFSGFLSEGVSEALKRKALQKLFHLPEFNIRDGLNDYDEDFSVFTPLGDTVTYQMKRWLDPDRPSPGDGTDPRPDPAEDNGQSEAVDPDGLAAEGADEQNLDAGDAVIEDGPGAPDQ